MKKETEEPKKIKKAGGWFIRKIIKVLIICAAIAALIFIATKIPKKENQVAETETPAVNVTVMKVSPKPQFADTFKLPAVIEPNRIVTVSAEIDGRIETIPLTEGSRLEGRSARQA
jgi:multidrug efflux pump subunit AcrA (membrane-fusion protein)